MNTVKLASILSQEIDYNESLKKQFHTEAKKVFKVLAKALNLEKGDFDLRSNKGGIGVSGEITLHTDSLYIQVSRGCMGENSSVLYRTCNGFKDYSGGQNNFINAKRLLDESFVSKLQSMA